MSLHGRPENEFPRTGKRPLTGPRGTARNAKGVQ